MTVSAALEWLREAVRADAAGERRLTASERIAVFRVLNLLADRLSK